MDTHIQEDKVQTA